MRDSTQSYYQDVGTFYDQSSGRHDELYWSNGTLQRIRQSFREHLKSLQMREKKILEVGIGTGIDILHFASIFPESTFYGIDVSKTMLEFTREKLKKNKCQNVTIRRGSVEDLEELFPKEKFDLIYVFFGALNTVEDLHLAMSKLHYALAPKGKIVVTFVNKYYLAEILIMLLKLNLKKAFARLQKVWTGYSNRYKVSSKCYSPTQVKTAIQGYFDIEDYKGFSILYPAWYRDRWVRRLGKKISWWLWRVDEMLNKTFAWKFGEYSLFILNKR